jgi:hypothetical protein
MKVNLDVTGSVSALRKCVPRRGKGSGSAVCRRCGD